MEFPATDLLRREHRDLERLLARFEGELSDPQAEGLLRLARTYAEIQGHLAAHFRKEEKVFYPTLAPSAATNDFEIARLIADHTDIRETSSAFQGLLDEAQAVAAPAVSVRADLSSSGWELWNLVHHHIAEEENRLLAFADRQLDSAAQAQLAAQMEAES